MKKMLFIILGTLLLFPLMGMNRDFNRMSNHADYVLMNELRNAGYVILPEVIVIGYRNNQDTINPQKRENIREKQHNRHEKGGSNFQKHENRTHERQPTLTEKRMECPKCGKK